MTPNIEAELRAISIIKKMGIYSALFNSTIQFNSVVFRVAVGVLSNNFLKAVAVITAIEFSLNWILDIPGGILSDRYGRVRCALVGLSLMTLAICSMYVVFFTGNETISNILIILVGVLLGIGKPLLSGSVEAFYQDALIREIGGAADNPTVRHSFSLSQRYGRFIPTVVTLIAFPLIYLLHKSIGSQHAFVFGIGMYLVVIFVLIRDSRMIGFSNTSSGFSSPSAIIKNYLSNHLMLFSSFLNLIFFAFAACVLGYLLMSIGHHLGPNSIYSWYSMAGFMAGYMIFGWIGSSYLLPLIIQRWSSMRILKASTALMLICSGFLFLVHGRLSEISWPIILLIFGGLFSVATNAIRGVMTNLLLSQVKRSDYATALSIQNVPAYAWVGIHSLLVTLLASGAPTLRATFMALIAISTFALLVLTMISLSTKGLWKTLTTPPEAISR